MSMDEALEFLREIEGSALASVGMPITIGIPRARIMSSIGEAIKTLVGHETDEAVQEGLNEQTAFVADQVRQQRIAGQDVTTWNDYVAQINNLGLNFGSPFDVSLLGKIPASVSETVAQSLENALYVCFIGILSESITESLYFSSVETCLRQGRFPAGWIGEFPSGDFCYL